MVRVPMTGSQVRGVGFYAERLFRALSRRGTEVEWVNFSYVATGEGRFDLLHYPYFDPFFLTLPVVKAVKTVVTVHDLIPLVFPQGFPRGVRGEVKWRVQRRLLQMADAVITVSESSKKDLEKFTGYPSERIFVIYEAAGEEFTRIKNGVLRRKYNLPEEFILYVGDVNYNKNVGGLIRAVREVREVGGGRDTKLVLVGKAFLEEGLPEVGAIRKEIKRLGLEDCILLPGFVPPKDLVYFYNLAKVYVQPSIYEGFGLPVVEAMACGCPVICGKNSSLPEVGGEAAVYADVGDPTDLARKIVGTLGLSAGEYEGVRQKCQRQARKFSWEKTAKETYEVYEKTIEGK